MSSLEFELIDRYFTHSFHRRDVIQSVGDDCALLQVPVNQLLAVSTDTLVSGTHFLPEISPADLAYKALMVNLSDLAAMGADPAWVSLAITLPGYDADWLQSFSDSFFQLLDQYQLQLVGGDSTRGPLSLTLTVHGFIPVGEPLSRYQAKAGDKIYVTGTLGDSGAGLALLLGTLSHQSSTDTQYLLQRHLRPQARVETGKLLRGIASSAIDLSDGLASDLPHILKASHCGARIYLDQLPLSEPLLRVANQSQAEQWALTGGEDYELCFTVPAEHQATLDELQVKQNIQYHCIGEITDEAGEMRFYRDDKEVTVNLSAYQHFSEKNV